MYYLPLIPPDILSQVIQNRIYFSINTIHELHRLLQQRTELNSNIQSEISEQESEIRSLLFSEKNSNLESKLIDLSKEKRDHSLSHWKDTRDLLKDLQSSNKELRNAILDLWMSSILK